MKASTIIPTSFIPILHPELDGADPRRVTLIHKRNSTLVCILSRGLEEVEYDKPIDDALILRMYDRNLVGLRYEPKVLLQRREVGNEGYTLVKIEESINHTIKKRKIPFFRSKEFLSEIVENGEGFDDKINDLLTAANERIVAYCEAIADHGIMFRYRSKNLLEKMKNFREAGKLIYDQMEGMFHEEVNEKPVKKHQLHSFDRTTLNYFSDPRTLTNRILGQTLLYGFVYPALTLMPTSFPEILSNEMKRDYQKRFDNIPDDKEKEAIALSEFATCNPKLISGIKRGYLEMKATCDLTALSLQLAASAYAMHNFSPWISIPLAIPAAISTATRIANAVRSGGLDYSGVISTIIDYKVREYFE